MKSSFLKHISFNNFSTQNRFFVKYIKFQRQKALKKDLNEEIKESVRGKQSGGIETFCLLKCFKSKMCQNPTLFPTNRTIN